VPWARHFGQPELAQQESKSILLAVLFQVERSASPSRRPTSIGGKHRDDPRLQRTWPSFLSGHFSGDREQSALFTNEHGSRADGSLMTFPRRLRDHPVIWSNQQITPIGSERNHRPVVGKPLNCRGF
jgi:hypothetical protein